jgi:DNA-binding NtrC family response regulator
LQWSADMDRPRILVIDDDELVRQALTRILRPYALVMSDNAASALAFVADGGMEFDAVLCDVWMTPLDGPTFFRELTSVRPELAGRVVFITGDAGTPRVVNFLAESGRPVIEKPFSQTDLKSAIEKVLAQPPHAAGKPSIRGAAPITTPRPARSPYFEAARKR